MQIFSFFCLPLCKRVFFPVVKMFISLKKNLCLGKVTEVLHTTALLVSFFSVIYNVVNSGLIT